MKERQLCTRQICFFFIAFMPIIKFFMLPSVVSEISKEDMWISTLLSLSIDFITAMALIYACKKTDLTFYGILKDRFGEVVTKTVYALYSIYFFVRAILPVIEQKDFIELSLYSTSPSIFNFLPFFIIAFYFAVKHLRIIGRASDVMWAITLIGFLFLIGLSVSNVDYGAILPIGASGFANVLKGTYASFAWYGDAVYLLFFMGHFKIDKNDVKKLVSSIICSSIMVLIFMLVFYGTFTSIAFRQKFALTEISKYSTVINNIGRVDYLGIFLIMASNIFSMSIPIYFCCYTLSKIIKTKNNRLIPFIITLLLFLVVTVFREYYHTIEDLLINKLNFLILLFSNVIPLFCAMIVLKKEKNAYELA